MGRIRSSNYYSDRLSFKYDISVDKAGLFSTTLPPVVVQQLKDSGIEVNRNRSGNDGYFNDRTMEGLITQVKKVADKFSSRELIERKIVLLYSLETTCSYCKRKDGELVPNGYHLEEIGGAGCKWEGGNIDTHAMHSAPYGFQVYVEPQIKEVYKFCDGKTVDEYHNLRDEDKKEGTTLYWLDSIVSMSKGELDPKEIEYNEKVGLFFKSLLLYIFNINEKLQAALNPHLDLSKPLGLELNPILGLETKNGVKDGKG